jgi:hypothetical protein
LAVAALAAPLGAEETVRKRWIKKLITTGEHASGASLDAYGGGEHELPSRAKCRSTAPFLNGIHVTRAESRTGWLRRQDSNLRVRTRRHAASRPLTLAMKRERAWPGPLQNKTLRCVAREFAQFSRPPGECWIPVPLPPPTASSQIFSGSI